MSHLYGHIHGGGGMPFYRLLSADPYRHHTIINGTIKTHIINLAIMIIVIWIPFRSFRSFWRVYPKHKFDNSDVLVSVPFRSCLTDRLAHADGHKKFISGDHEPTTPPRLRVQCRSIINSRQQNRKLASAADAGWLACCSCGWVLVHRALLLVSPSRRVVRVR